MRLFLSEEGYTSVAVAVALLVSIVLVFCVASVEWVSARSADVQAIADAAALAGSNSVAAYYTVAQTADACVVSLGLAGVAVMGMGLICAAVPGMQEPSVRAIETGKRILRNRTSFARRAARGLRSVEQALPYACMANAASCASANWSQTLRYRGFALPVPLDSASDFSALETELDTGDLDKAAGRIREATEEVETAKRKADEALERAWKADCVDAPSCLSSRAASLAHLGIAQNPVVASPQTWSFALPIRRSRAYYAARLRQEAPLASDIESVTDSLAREAFYEYALDEVRAAWCQTLEDGSVSLNLPHLARNSQEVRATWLYTDQRWPTSLEEQGVILHATDACPGATGEAAGYASVAMLEEGTVHRCAVCAMDVSDLGAVAAISTTATNGYEHYWQIIVEAASDYEQARCEQADAERAVRTAADEGSGVFERVLDQLRGPRLHVAPPGRDGCVSAVLRAEGAATPTELTRAFTEGCALPAGVAVSAACLRADDASDGNDVLGRFFDGAARAAPARGTGLMRGVMGLWGRLLVSYAHAYEGVERSVGDYYETADGVFGTGVGSWLRARLVKAVEALGLEPADMRLHKPVLASTREVLQSAGVEPQGKVRALIEAMPADGSLRAWAHTVGIAMAEEVVGNRVLIADLELPGTDVHVPLSVDLTCGDD